MQKKRLYDSANFSHHDLILSFTYQLIVKIRCDRKLSDRITFDKKWVHAMRLVVGKEATLESSFPSSSCAWQRWSWSFGTPSPVSRQFLVPYTPFVSCIRCVIGPSIRSLSSLPPHSFIILPFLQSHLSEDLEPTLLYSILPIPHCALPHVSYIPLF